MRGIILDWIGTLADIKGKSFTYSANILKKVKKTHKIGLVTRSLSGKKKRERQLKQSGLLVYFDAIVINPKSKTTNDFLKCMKILGVKPEETIVVGDMASKEIRAGNKLGCTTVWLSEGDKSWDKPTKRSDEPDYILPTIKELKNVIW